jgi:hypothetical protein
MNNGTISDEVPPMYPAFKFIGSLIIQSEIGVIPLCGDGDGEFFTFGSDAKASQLSKIPEMIHISQVREIMRDAQVARANPVAQAARVAPVAKVKALEQVEGVTDDAYLHMTVREFNYYAKTLGLNDHQKSILVLARRRMNNREYSKTARLKRKNNESNKQNIIKNDAKMPPYSDAE